MTNLLAETLEDIARSGHSPDDIVYIGNLDASNHWTCTWEQFASIADVEYDASFGSQEVASDLVIMFNDGARLERGEYDGSEWWEQVPVLGPLNAPSQTITRLTGNYWPSLADLHNPEDAHHGP